MGLRQFFTSKRSVAAVGTSLAAMLALAGCGGPAQSSPPSGGNSEPTYTVGILSMAQSSLLDSVIAAFEDSVRAGMGDKTVKFDIKNANGDQSLITSISRDFAGSQDDAFAVIGTPAVIALSAQIKDRPIFALAMGDPVGAGVAKNIKTPGGNVTGSIDYVDPQAVLDELMAVKPDTHKIGTIYDPSNQNLQVWIADLKKAVGKYPGLSISEATVAGASEVAQASRSLLGRSDIMLIGPDANVTAGMESVAATAVGASTPLWLTGGDASIAGVLGSIGPNYPALGTSAGQQAAKVLLGAKPAETPFTLPEKLEITINGKTQKQLSITFPEKFLSRATVL
jgi:putative tryptophan/tyrosine transport system substrate-binding protein